MKKISYLFLLFLIVFACEEQDAPNPSIPVQGAEGSRILHPGDPNLNPNWNWEGSEWMVWFRNLSGTTSNAIGTVNPFYDVSNVSIFGNADPSKIDIRASDGWMLVARDFGTPSAAPRLPWIMLYNKYRGLLRVCVYKTSELSDSHQTLTLSFDSSVPAPGFFIFTEENQQVAYSEAPNQQWMVGEFNLQGYDPSIHQQARLQVKIQGVEETLTYQEGGITLTGVAQPKPKPLGVSDLFDIASYSSKLYEKLPDFGDETFKNVVKGLTKSELLSAAGGLIKSFTSSGKSPMYNISLQGSISLRGTMKQTLPIGNIGVYIRTDANNSGQYKALNAIPWGIMKYDAPIELIAQFVDYVDLPPLGHDRFKRYFLRTKLGNPFDGSGFSFNPEIGSDGRSVIVGFVYPNEEEVHFRPFGQLMYTPLGLYFYMPDGTYPNYGPYPQNYNALDYLPTHLAVRCMYPNGDIVYNKIPVELPQMIYDAYGN